MKYPLKVFKKVHLFFYSFNIILFKTIILTTALLSIYLDRAKSYTSLAKRIVHAKSKSEELDELFAFDKTFH